RPMDSTWSRCEWLIRMWSMRASCSSGRSPTPVPASIRMESSSRNDVVLQPAAMAPEQPSTRMIMALRESAVAALQPGDRCCAFHSHVDPRRPRAQGAKVAISGQTRPCGHAVAAAVRIVTAGRHAPSELDELHLRPGELDDVAVLQLHRFLGERMAVDRGAGGAFDMGEDVAAGPLGDRGDLYAGLAYRGDDLGEVDLAA